MYIKDTPRDKYKGFTLEMDKIELHSVSKQDIKLPYTGKLPATYDTATLFMRITPEYQGLNITAKKGKTEKRYIVEATRAEIKQILQPFLFHNATPTSEATRFDNGLSEYWIGRYETEYFAWYLLDAQPARIVGIIHALSPEMREEFFRDLERYRTENTGDAPPHDDMESDGEEEDEEAEDDEANCYDYD